MGAKFAAAHTPWPQVLLGKLAEEFVETVGKLCRGGIRKRRPVAVTRVGVERELAHHKKRSAHVHKREVGATVLVGADAKLAYLLPHAPGDVLVIIGANAEKHEVTFTA